jgi:hypothetical protein
MTDPWAYILTRGLLIIAVAVASCALGALILNTLTAALTLRPL